MATAMLATSPVTPLLGLYKNKNAFIDYDTGGEITQKYFTFYISTGCLSNIVFGDMFSHLCDFQKQGFQ